MMMVIRILGMLFILIGLALVVFVAYKSKVNNNKPRKRKRNHRFCILIPARDESRVIGGLLESIKNQTYKIKMEDVYVIIENEKDKTNEICKTYGASVVVRKKLHLKSKGYALDEGIEEILKRNKKYDAYFIFDADNILDKNYLKNMIPSFDKGYDIASGYRNCKNGNDSVIAACSSLTFSLINTVFNDQRCRDTKNITLSGTGFYVSGDLIERWGCYPFHSLTEDYELSCYAILNNLTTYYNTKSIFYDEQPLTYNKTIGQRVRWIRGYFDVRKNYVPKIKAAINEDEVNKGSKIEEVFGVTPYVFIVIGIVVWLLGTILKIVCDSLLHFPIMFDVAELLILSFSVYLALLVITFIMINKEKDKLDLSYEMKIKALLFNPIFLCTFVSCAIRALLKKEVTWTKVEHGIKKD